MLTKSFIAAPVCALLVGCSSVSINTQVAPNADLSSLKTFQMMTPPHRRDGVPGPNDPMLDNSITNRALSDAIATSFQARGYTAVGTNPDFTVAYYASARERLDVTQWNYGYPGRWGGWYGPVGYQVTPFVEGTVIVDVVDAKTHALVWRGRGVSTVSPDPNIYSRNLDYTARKIVEKFPQAAVRLSEQ
jgi:hypothetical protein